MKDFVCRLKSHMQIIVSQIIAIQLKTAFKINFDTNLMLDTDL